MNLPLAVNGPNSLMAANNSSITDMFSSLTAYYNMLVVVGSVAGGDIRPAILGLYLLQNLQNPVTSGNSLGARSVGFMVPV